MPSRPGSPSPPPRPRGGGRTGRSGCRRRGWPPPRRWRCSWSSRTTAATTTRRTRSGSPGPRRRRRRPPPPRRAPPPRAPAAPEAKSTALAAPAGAGAELQAPAVQRRVERAGALTLTTPARKIHDTADGVVAVVDRVGGYVERSDVGQASGGGQATFELRVPTARLDATLAALSRLGHVQSRAQHSQDITAIFNAAAQRLHDARAERDALLRALAKATTAEQTASLRARLRVVRSEIAAARGDLAAARRRADLARVSVTVIGRGGGTGATTPGGGRWTPGDALRDAVHVLGVAAGVAILAAAIAVPLGLLVGLAALAARALRRRRREAALDGGAPAV